MRQSKRTRTICIAAETLYRTVWPARLCGHGETWGGGVFFLSRPCSEGTCDAKGKTSIIGRFSRVWAENCQVYLLDTSPRDRRDSKTYHSSSGPSLRFLCNCSKHLCVLAALGANLWQTSKDGYHHPKTLFFIHNYFPEVHMIPDTASPDLCSCPQT